MTQAYSNSTASFSGLMKDEILEKENEKQWVIHRHITSNLRRVFRSFALHIASFLQSHFSLWNFPRDYLLLSSILLLLRSITVLGLSNGVSLSRLVKSFFNICLYFLLSHTSSIIFSSFLTIFFSHHFIYFLFVRYLCFYSSPYFPPWFFFSPLMLSPRMLLECPFFSFIHTNNCSIERAMQTCRSQAGMASPGSWHIAGIRSITAWMNEDRNRVSVFQSLTWRRCSVSSMEWLGMHHLPHVTHDLLLLLER